MADYIDREAAIEAAYQGLKRPNEDPKWIDICENLKAVPSADVKPVVFCKDCKKYKTKFCAIDIWTDQVTIYKATPYDYCSRGERGNDNG